MSTTTTAARATFCRIDARTWGVRVPSTMGIVAHKMVCVHKSDGSTSEVALGYEVAPGIYEIAKAARKPASTNGQGRYSCGAACCRGRCEDCA